MKLFEGILKAISITEVLITAVKGKKKQDAALNIIGVLVPAINELIGKEALNLEEIKEAMKSFIDSAVNLRNVVLRLTGKDIFNL